MRGSDVGWAVEEWFSGLGDADGGRAMFAIADIICCACSRRPVPSPYGPV